MLALIAVNGLLSGAEIAVVSVRPARLDALTEEGKRGAAALRRLRQDPERFLATVQVGITVVGAAAAAFGGASFAQELAPVFARIEWLAPYAYEVALAVIVVAISYLSLVLGELCPKSLALRHSERYALLVARPLLGLASFAKPVVWFLTASSNVVLKPFRDSTNFMESKISLDEIRRMVEDAGESGSVDPDVSEIASRALEFSTLTAEDVMIHRRYVVGLPASASDAEIRRVILDVGHRRVPVFEGSLDNIVGYVSWRDVMGRAWSGKPVTLDGIVRPCHFVPETTPAIDLLREMQEKRIHLSIAVDEHGGTAGILTLEDLLEELVGEIVSEHDAAPTAQVRRDPDGTFVVQGSANVRDVNRELELALPGEDEVSTIAGLCLLLNDGHLPLKGARLETESGVELEVLETSARRVRSVRLHLPRTVG
ncbi:MAG: hemolysin family protein [Planctomycetota bacterium]